MNLKKILLIVILIINIIALISLSTNASYEINWNEVTGYSKDNKYYLKGNIKCINQNCLNIDIAIITEKPLLSTSKSYFYMQQELSKDINSSYTCY